MTNDEAIFAEALSKGSAPDRSAYLDQACAGDAGLRREVEALLRAHQRADGILEAPPAGLDLASMSATPSECVGSTVGPYRVLEQIGGGGMGVVYMAEQLRPVRRKVALKIIKPGMDSGQVIARFEAERQALTMMDHPNIAKVLDAGTTDTGRPYFVMELVKGIAITDYCDRARLATRERLELFIKVCHAVQHAHQKGIIHRDLKPGNVLVTLHDDKPVPKVIDFGIAKAAGQVLTDRTLFTNYAQMLGTPLYMSPEQAQISGLDVDTRSDIYSLGVLLYELLTGTTPFDRQRLHDAAYDEMRRIIREEDPPTPSTQLSRGLTLASVAANRHTEPAKLTHLIRGELDWIVMKSLDKDRARRYETANGLAMDVQRYLANETVLAAPASAGYRFRKLARRNKGPLAAIAAVALALVIGLSIATWQAVRAAEGKRVAEAEAKKARAVADVMTAILARANPYRGGEGEYTVLRMVDEFVSRLNGDLGKKLKQDPQAELELRTLLGKYYSYVLLPKKAAPQLERAIELLRRSPASEENPEVAALFVTQGWNQIGLNDFATAERLGREALSIAERTPPSAPGATIARAATLQLLQRLAVLAGRYDEADEFGRRALAVLDANPRNVTEFRTSVLRELSNSAAGRGQLEEGENYARAALTNLEALGNTDTLAAAWAFESLAYRLQERGKYEEAELYARKGLTILKRELGDRLPESSRDLLIRILTSRGDQAGLARLRDEQQALTAKRASSTRP